MFGIEPLQASSFSSRISRLWKQYGRYGGYHWLKMILVNPSDFDTLKRELNPRGDPESPFQAVMWNDTHVLPHPGVERGKPLACMEYRLESGDVK